MFEPNPKRGLNGAVAAALRAEHGRKKVTYEAIATATGLSKTSVERYLNGKRHMDLAVVDGLARALGSTAEDVMREVADQRRRETEARDARRRQNAAERTGLTG